MSQTEEKDLALHIVKTISCGDLKVYVQGDLECAQKEEKCTFLSVHDMGSNYKSFVDFTHESAMEGILHRAVFVHVVVPGQEPGAQDLEPDFHFPTMQELGESLVLVLDELKLKYVLGLGEGAGANIITRFGMKYPTRCLGVVLIHPTSTTAGMMEFARDQIIKWKLGSFGHNPTAEQYLVFHKFGHMVSNATDKEKAMEHYKVELHSHINPRNLKAYVESFLNRTDLSHRVGTELKADALLLAGSKSSFLHSVDTMYSHCDRTKTSLLRVDGVGDVMEESPEKVAQALLLFCQGLGLLTSLGIGNRSRSGSVNPDRRPSVQCMQDYDKPNLKRLSLSTKGEGGENLLISPQ